MRRMRLLAGILVVIQFCFAYHVLKTGRPYWWIFIIMGFPVMGCVIYYFVEVFPGSREQRRAAKAARAIARVLEPDAELKKRVADLEIATRLFATEGEAIAWHIAEEIKDENKNLHRVLINEITNKGVKNGVGTPIR